MMVWVIIAGLDNIRRAYIVQGVSLDMAIQSFRTRMKGLEIYEILEATDFR